MDFVVINSLKEKLLRSVGVQHNEIQLSLDEGLQQYTENWYDKISNVKTFLFNENSVRFEEIYVPLSLRYEKKEIELPENVESLFKINNYITIVGHAGSGKTMLMKHSFLNILKQSNYIPVIIELRRIDNTSMTLSEYISSSVFKLNMVRNESVFNQLLGEGRFVFFFDGYDEVAISNKEVRSSEIEEFSDRYNKNLFMLTSRPGAGAESLSRYRTYHVCKMDDHQIKLFIEKQSRYMDEEGDQVAQKIISTVFGSNNSTIKEYLSNPLLLSMFILTFKYTPELPSKRSGFYFNVFDTLYCKHDTTSKTGGYLHERKCKMERDQYLRVLQTFSYNSYFSSKYEFDNSYVNSIFEKIKKAVPVKFNNDDMIYDLNVSIGIWILDGLTYNFPHRSMQEYFAASLIKNSDEEIRKMVYSQILTKKYGQDGYNFWSLCREMDEYRFLRYFVLHNLKEFESMIEKVRDDSADEKKTLLLNFLDMIDLYIRVNGRRVTYMRHKPNLYISILRFLDNSFDLTDVFFMYFFHLDNGFEEFRKYQLIEDEDLIKLDTNNGDIVDFLVASTILEEFYKSYEQIKDFVTQMEKDLNIMRKREINFLGL